MGAFGTGRPDGEGREKKNRSRIGCSLPPSPFPTTLLSLNTPIIRNTFITIPFSGTFTSCRSYLPAFGSALGAPFWTSLGITILYLPFIVMNWRHMSPLDFNRILEIVVFNAVAAVLGFISDREKAREKALRESESLAAMGSALSAVAHDMANPLTAMGGFARLLEEKPGIDDDSRRKLGFIIKGTERLEAMVKDMLDFSRPLDLRLTKEDMNQAVRDSVAILEHKTKEKKVNIQLELSPDLPPVPFDCGRMERVFLNLVSNAIDASPEGETVAVRTRLEGDEALLEVADRGPGIPAGIQGKNIYPFFYDEEARHRAWPRHRPQSRGSPWRGGEGAAISGTGRRLQGFAPFVRKAPLIAFFFLGLASSWPRRYFNSFPPALQISDA